MVQKTETVYETVEKEIEVTYCDVCGMDYDDGEIAQVAINPETQSIRALNRHPDDLWHYIDSHRTTAYPDGSPRMVYGTELPQDDHRAYMELQRLRQEVQELQDKFSYASPLRLDTDGMYDVCRDCLESSLGVETLPTKETNFQVVEREPWTKSRVLDGLAWLFSRRTSRGDEQMILLTLIFTVSWIGTFASVEFGLWPTFIPLFLLGAATTIPLVRYALFQTFQHL